MRTSKRYLIIVCSLLLTVAGFSSPVAADPALFFDDFEDRVADQADIGHGWTWFVQAWDGDSCTGAPDFQWGPWSDGNGNDLLAANRNYFTANADGSYYRAGLEMDAWEGALSNMLRVYGDQYLTYSAGCERVLIFQEMPIASAGDLTFSFDLAQAQYGSPQNGEVTGAFVKVIQANDPWATLYTQEVLTTPPAPPAVGSQSIDLTIPAEFVGELLQFGFYNDVTENLGQSWADAAITYDNVQLDPTVVVPPEPPGEFSGVAGVPIPLWALFGIVGLLAVFGAAKLRSEGKAK